MREYSFKEKLALFGLPILFLVSCCLVACTGEPTALGNSGTAHVPVEELAYFNITGDRLGMLEFQVRVLREELTYIMKIISITNAPDSPRKESLYDKYRREKANE